jgi:hypothetical protein
METSLAGEDPAKAGSPPVRSLKVLRRVVHRCAPVG